MKFLSDSSAAIITIVSVLWTSPIPACCQNPQPSDPGTMTVACAVDGGETGDDFSDDHSQEALAMSTPCAKACETLATFHCSEAKKHGSDTCIQVCHSIGPISSYDPSCVAAAKSEADIKKCPKASCTH